LSTDFVDPAMRTGVGVAEAVAAAVALGVTVVVGSGAGVDRTDTDVRGRKPELAFGPEPTRSRTITAARAALTDTRLHLSCRTLDRTGVPVPSQQAHT
jgi:hypothetical protein